MRSFVTKFNGREVEIVGRGEMNGENQFWAKGIADGEEVETVWWTVEDNYRPEDDDDAYVDEGTYGTTWCVDDLDQEKYQLVEVIYK